MHPIVAVILNLPPNLRTKKENMLLLGMFISGEKPDMNMLLETFASNFAIYFQTGNV